MTEPNENGKRVDDIIINMISDMKKDNRIQHAEIKDQIEGYKTEIKADMREVKADLKNTSNRVDFLHQKFWLTVGAGSVLFFILTFAKEYVIAIIGG